MRLTIPMDKYKNIDVNFCFFFTFLRYLIVTVKKSILCTVSNYMQSCFKSASDKMLFVYFHDLNYFMPLLLKNKFIVLLKNVFDRSSRGSSLVAAIISMTCII